MKDVVCGMYMPEAFDRYVSSLTEGVFFCACTIRNICTSDHELLVYTELCVFYYSNGQNLKYACV